MFNRNKVQRMLDTLFPSCFNISQNHDPPDSPSPNRHVLMKGLVIQMVWKTCLCGVFVVQCSFCSGCFIILSFTTTTCLIFMARSAVLKPRNCCSHFGSWLVELRFVGLLSQGGCETHSWCFVLITKRCFLGRMCGFWKKIWEGNDGSQFEDHLFFWKMGWPKSTRGFVFKDSLPMLMLQKSFLKEESHEISVNSRRFTIFTINFPLIQPIFAFLKQRR